MAICCSPSIWCHNSIHFPLKFNSFVYLRSCLNRIHVRLCWYTDSDNTFTLITLAWPFYTSHGQKCWNVCIVQSNVHEHVDHYIDQFAGTRSRKKSIPFENSKQTCSPNTGAFTFWTCSVRLFMLSLILQYLIAGARCCY